MACTSALLGQGSDNPNVHPEKSDDEKDLQSRSTRKIKEGEHIFNTQSSLPKDYSDAVDMQSAEAFRESYKEKVMGRKDTDEMEEEQEDADVELEKGVNEERMKMVKGRIGDYECPEFILSKFEEKRIYRPWRRGVIVKLLGRRIGYKALETRLKQMWVRKGSINIIDLSNDYYLVAFTNEEDQYAALMDGPWFIYDHYLTVQEWKPNFNPISDTIKEVAVWMRISGLPIEYYDSQILSFIGNNVGKTVKVDKNTLTQERGKYARLCVQVDLTKPLLAMFTLKGRKYTIEYEGLHMLCMTCGRFGHYKEGCPAKKNDAVNGEGKVNDGQARISNSDDTGADGPWRIVQKQRRNKKIANGRNNMPAVVNVSPAKINEQHNLGGSRFDVLNADLCETNVEINVEQNGELRDVDEIRREPILEIRENNEEAIAGRKKQNKNKRVTEGDHINKGLNATERGPKASKLATRVGNTFKGKSGASAKKGVEQALDKMGVNIIGDLMGQTGQPKTVSMQNFAGKENNGEYEMGRTDTSMLGPKSVINPNMPRPPDNVFIPPTLQITPPVIKPNEDLPIDGEVFEDANDQGSNLSSDSDMELVVETPNLA
jgi:hypothetical protein